MGLFKSPVRGYFLRHRNNINRLLHIIGIPLVLFGIFQLFSNRWKTGILNFFLGYLLQYIGHLYFEKNELGEWIIIKKIVKRAKGADYGRLPKDIRK